MRQTEKESAVNIKWGRQRESKSIVQGSRSREYGCGGTDMGSFGLYTKSDSSWKTDPMLSVGSSEYSTLISATYGGTAPLAFSSSFRLFHPPRDAPPISSRNIFILCRQHSPKGFD
uniref:Uncharacterized protein n=1 Tax=Nelumbo nucifera TaxID=4432 RepID=A0A822YJZ9_NELNU|nr:TPA_asm: hypothetical protein HUJ06_010146 [Nelumbo nucifera]